MNTIFYAYFVFLSTQTVHGEISLRKLYPLITPVLGNISLECKNASYEYVENLSGALSAKGKQKVLTDGQKDALQMFESNGPFPFLQEGRLQDVVEINICDFLSGGNATIWIGCVIILGDLGVFNFPYGYSNGPGAENQCRSVPSAQYCNNYYSINLDSPDWKPIENLTRKHLQNFGRFRDFQHQDFSKMFDLSKISLKLLEKTANYGFDENEDFDASGLVDLTDILVQKNSYTRKLHDKIQAIIMIPEIQEIIQAKDDPPGIDDLPSLLLYFLMLYWWLINWSFGPGLWGFQPQISYQGFCYPAQCSKEDINTNNLIFARDILKFDNFISQSPLVPPYMGEFLQTDQEFIDQVLLSSVGCSNDERYNEEWKAENYIMVTLLSVIGFFILVGTIIEHLSRQKHEEKIKHGMGFKILTSFSIISNMEFIFKVSDGKKGQRFDCLEGMRAISMTWVILGHNFIFGASLLHIRNHNYINQIWNHEVGGHWLEAIKQGEFSVDSFLFIGATLLSFLLLKDLEKTNGWFHLKGIKRMILFYLNRYLRITIPYALVIGVYIGIIPLMITEPMRVKSLAYIEADSCKKYWWKHLTYNQIFGNNSDACIGQTWYLAFDMIVFLVSPLVIYPFWLAKKGTAEKVFAISLWCLLFMASMVATVGYVYQSEEYENYAYENNLPSWDFAPWGYRNHCYLIGLMTGYILHVYRNKEFKISRVINMILWLIVFILSYLMVYAPYWIKGEMEGRAYWATRKAVWGVCLSWVTISCIKGYGGPVNDFLSWGLWQPISKISFMTYFFHMSSNFYYFVAQGYDVDVSLWLFTEIFVSQLVICLFNGLMGCLALELPFGRIQKLLMR